MKISVLSTLATLFAGIVPSMGKKYDVTEAGVDFTVSYYEDGRALPYAVGFTVEEVSTMYTFGITGLIKRIESGVEAYEVEYTDGSLQAIVDLSGRRQLIEDDGPDDAIPKQGSDRRLKASCTGCFSSWEALCEVGRPSVYGIISTDAPAAARGVLSDDAKAGASLFQKHFKGACDTMGAYTVCDGCTCIPALQISLQAEDEGDIDLLVTEPSGTVVNFANRDGDFGFLDNDNIEGVGSDPENYLVTDGLTGSSMLGTYSVKVSRYDTPGDIFFKLKATVDGKKVWKKKYTLKDGDAESRTWTVKLNSYVDNQCTSMAFNIIDEGDAPTKTPP